MINNGFDILNCRSRWSKRFETHKIPISESTRDTLENYVNEITNYIISLELENGQKLTRSRRQCGFVGMIVSLRNALALFDFLHEKYNLEYLLTYKLLQDHIENFFSAIRLKGGFNNNPDSFQFRCAYRRLLIHHDVTSSDSANCEADNIPILAVTLPKKEETKELDEATLENYEMFNFENVEEIPSEVLIDVIHYIGGFIVRKLSEKKCVKICIDCLQLLIDENSTSSLIEIKDRGGLKRPSQAVINICLKVEQIIRNNYDKIFLPGFVDNTIECILTQFDLLFPEAAHDSHHKETLVTLVCNYYLKIRLHFECNILSEVDHYIRRTMTKLVTHKHQ
jgi:hypothetical protein